MLDARERLAMLVGARRLQAEERLVGPERLGKEPVAVHVAVMAADTEDRLLRAVRLQRHDRALLAHLALDRAQEIEDAGLVLPQEVGELDGERAGRRVAAKQLAVGPDADVAAAQLVE